MVLWDFALGSTSTIGIEFVLAHIYLYFSKNSTTALANAALSEVKSLAAGGSPFFKTVETDAKKGFDYVVKEAKALEGAIAKEVPNWMAQRQSNPVTAAVAPAPTSPVSATPASVTTFAPSIAPSGSTPIPG